MRRAVRLSPVDVMLLGTVFLWALNVTVTKYLLDHGFHPLGYATIRYGAAGLLFWSFTYAREQSFRIQLSDTKLVVLAGGLIFVNQLLFVYGVKETSASTVGLLLGTTPIFIGILSTVFGLELLGRRFWAGAVLSFVGVGSSRWAAPTSPATRSPCCSQSEYRSRGPRTRLRSCR
jgi:drug/metabolite transporter (DMT)-like permease